MAVTPEAGFESRRPRQIFRSQFHAKNLSRRSAAGAKRDYTSQVPGKSCPASPHPDGQRERVDHGWHCALEDVGAATRVSPQGDILALRECQVAACVRAAGLCITGGSL